METEKNNPSFEQQSETTPYASGAIVMYGTHGKCVIKSIEIRSTGDGQKMFYKLEPVRSVLSRSKKPEPAIWLPVENAKKIGLRSLMTIEQAQQVMEILSSREYYFPIHLAWNKVITEINASIAMEGAIGLAKAISYTHALQNRQMVPASEVSKFFEAMFKLLSRELAEIFNEPIKSTEIKMKRALKHKMLPDH